MKKFADFMRATEVDETDSVEVACTKVMEAVADRRDNGGTNKEIRDAAISLLSSVCANT